MSLPIEEPSVTPEKGHQVKLSQGRERDEREVRWGRKASPKDEMHGDRVKARKEFSHYLWQKSHSDKRDFLVISPKGLWVIKLQCLVCHWWPKERLLTNNSKKTLSGDRHRREEDMTNFNSTQAASSRNHRARRTCSWRRSEISVFLQQVLKV